MEGTDRLDPELPRAPYYIFLNTCVYIYSCVCVIERENANLSCKETTTTAKTFFSVSVSCFYFV